MKTNLTVCLLLCLFALQITAQQAPNQAGKNVAQHACANLALTSDTPALPSRLIAPYLERRADFQLAKLVLSDQAGGADVLVQLSKADAGLTRIRVTNRLTGQQSSVTSRWTDYPGMVATDTIEQIKMVCAELNVASASLPVTPPCDDSTLLRPRQEPGCLLAHFVDGQPRDLRSAEVP